MKYVVGVLQDVPIKVGDLYVLVDFVILEMEKDMHTTIILRRSFLTTAGCRIDVKNGKLSFDMGDDHLKNLTCLRLLRSLLYLMSAYIINSLVWKTITRHDSNYPLEHCIE